MNAAPQVREIDIQRLLLTPAAFQAWNKARRAARTEPVDLDAALSECWLALSDCCPDAPSDDLQEAARSLCAYGLGALQDDFTSPDAKALIRNYVARIEARLVSAQSLSVAA